MANIFVPDDEAVPIIGDVGVSSERKPLGFNEQMLELAVSAQRLSISRVARRYGVGSVKVAASEPVIPAAERMFNLPKLVEWVDGEPEELVTQMLAGRLRCRFSAAMGMGKSTKMPAYVAKHTQSRVLYVTLDAVLLQQNIDRVHEVGYGRFSRRWSPRKQEWLVGMTYADFVGIMASAQRVALFSSFETIIFDEGDSDLADVFVAKSAFARFSQPHNNLVLCGATVKKAEAHESGGAERLGNFREVTQTITVSDAIASGRLVSEYLADRTFLLVPDDGSVHQAAAYYDSHGVDAYALDSAASRDDFARVCDQLEGDASTPRVVVAHCLHGIGLNMPVSQVLVFPYENVQVFDGTVVKIEREQMTEDFVTQCKSRTGRGIVAGSGGAIFGAHRAEKTPLRQSQKMAAFVKMFAAGIVPNNNAFWSKQYALFPKGMDTALAVSLVKICLPVEVAIRYFAEDGRVASKYLRALHVFCQPNSFLMESKYEEPASISEWVEEDFVADEESAIRVPMHADGELQVAIQAISCIAEGMLEMDRWVPVMLLDLDDGYDSSEERRIRHQKRLPVLRRVQEPQFVESTPEVKKLEWQYTGRSNAGARSGGFIDRERFAEALADMERLVNEYAVQNGMAGQTSVNVVKGETKEPQALIEYSSGSVESPGGSVVCTLPRTICEKVNNGMVLSESEMVEFISSVRGESMRVATSKLFDNFAKPWDSMITTLNTDRVLQELSTRGLITDTFIFFDHLRRRFGIETTNVLAGSHVFKTRFFRIFSKMPSCDSVFREMSRGQFDKVAQSEGFIERVKYLKERMDVTLIGAERIGVYLPNYITAAQRALPLRGANVLGYVGDGLHTMPKEWKRALAGTRAVPRAEYSLGQSGG